jgi:hypothetical protein
MAKTLKFYGSSDDSFCVEGGGHDDEIDNCANGQTMAFNVRAGDGSCYVTGQYAPDCIAGVWTIGLAQEDEDKPLPPWPMRFEVAERAYSTMLVIDAPDDVEVLSCGVKEDDD